MPAKQRDRPAPYCRRMADAATDPDELFELAMGSPKAALRIGPSMIDGSGGSHDVRVMRALGVAHRRLENLASSEQYLRASVEAARQLEDRDLEDLCTMSLAATELFLGRGDSAISQLTAVANRATGSTRAEAWFQLGTAHAQLGALDRAVSCYEMALPLLREHQRFEVESSLLANRGLMYFHLGRYQDALADMEAAEAGYAARENYASLYRSTGNRAMTLFRLGELTDALRLFEETAAGLAGLDINPARLAGDRCETLVATGHFKEALDQAQTAYIHFTETNNRTRQIEALVFGAEAALLVGELDLARELARNALSLDAANQVPVMAARAELLILRSRIREGTTTTADLAAACELAERLRPAAPAIAVEAQLEAAHVALIHDRLDEAAQLLESDRRRSVQPALHLEAYRWSLMARLHLATGDQASALGAVDAGLDAVARLRSAVGSYETRTRVGHHAEAIAAVAVSVLTRRDDPTRLRQILEELRSGSLHYVRQPSAAPPALQAALHRLRVAETDRDGNQLALVELQREVATLSRLESRMPELVSTDEVVGDDEQYLVYFRDRGRLGRITETAAGASIVDCGPLASVVELAERLSSCEHRLAWRSKLSPAVVAAVHDDHSAAAHALARLLLPEDLEATVVISAPPELAAVSWAALPGLYEREHCIVPALSLARRPLPSNFGKVVVTGGSELAHVAEEVRAVATAYGVSAQLDPPASIIRGVCEADVWHAAGHFSANGSNPLFGAVDLGGFRLHGYDILAEDAAPTIAVLSACHSASSETVGRAALGLATALLASGSAAVAVTQAIVEDGPALANLMARFHQHLVDGLSPAAALCAVRAGTRIEDRPLAATISLLGAGW